MFAVAGPLLSLDLRYKRQGGSPRFFLHLLQDMLGHHGIELLEHPGSVLARGLLQQVGGVMRPALGYGVEQGFR